MSTADHASGFNHHDPDVMQNPYALYAEVRGRCPVEHSDQLGGFFYTLSYDSVRQVLSDYAKFTSTHGVALPAHANKMLPVDLDPPLQTAFRKVLNKFFSAEHAERSRPRIESVVSRLIDDFIERGDADMAAELTRPTLSAVMLPLIGVQDADVSQLTEALEFSAHHRLSDPAEYERKNLYIIGYLMELAARRRRSSPQSDFVQFLIDHDIGGDKLSDEDIFRVLLVTLFGALDTTHATLNEAVLHLCHNPADKALLSQGGASWAGAIEEFVRFASPIQAMRRTVTAPIEYFGQRLNAGDAILALNGAGNRDPARFADPDRCILTRDARDHLGFGAGAHVCLGRNFARVMIEVVLKAALARLPDLAVAADFVPTYTTGEARGMKSLPVTFTPGLKTA